MDIYWFLWLIWLLFPWGWIPFDKRYSVVLSHFCSLLLWSSYAQYYKWTKWTFTDFYDSYGFCFLGVRYLLTKGIHCHRHISVPFYSGLVNLNIINGQNGHLLIFMIHMASVSLGMNTFWQKVFIGTVTFLFTSTQV